MEEFDLEPGEAIITQVRQHIFVLLWKLLPFVVLAIIPLFVTSALSAFKASASLSSSVRFFLGIWWLFVWMGAFAVIVKYFLNSWVITSHRIVDIYQKGFFRRKVSSFLLVRVQDVTTNVHGIFATLLGFGDINVETAGSAETFMMKGINSPENLRDLIMREVALLHRDDDAVKTGL